MIHVKKLVTAAGDTSQEAGDAGQEADDTYEEADDETCEEADNETREEADDDTCYRCAPAACTSPVSRCNTQVTQTITHGYCK